MAQSLAFFAVAALAVLGGVTSQSTYLPDLQNIYHLFTRDNPITSQPMILGVEALVGGFFNPARDTVLLIHGYASGPLSDFNVALIPNILAAADVNVIAVDWTAGAYLPNYQGVIGTNLPLSAESIARFITWFNLVTGANISQYHIIGFEVSAHQAGLVGRFLQGQVPHITALNPPREGWNETNVFRPTDGIYTEAIHTDLFGTGIQAPVAQVDVYPNGGVTMPGCSLLDWECSHDRSFQYLAESIRFGGFTSVQCETLEDVVVGTCDSNVTISMGGLTPKTGVTGLFYVTTNAQSPYSTG